jgi:hypothetical protein
MTETGDRIARLRKLAGVMLGTGVRSIAPLREDGSGLDVLLFRLADARPVPAWVDGELRLRVLTHAWRLESRERVLAGGLDPRELLGPVLEELVGRTVSAMGITRPGLDTTLVFGDVQLRLFPVSSLPLPEGYPAWTLRIAQGVTLIAGPGGTWGMTGRRPEQQEVSV